MLHLSREPVRAKHGLSASLGLNLPSQSHSESINIDLFKGVAEGSQNSLVSGYHKNQILEEWGEVASVVFLVLYERKTIKRSW